MMVILLLAVVVAALVGFCVGHETATRRIGEVAGIVERLLEEVIVAGEAMYEELRAGPLALGERLAHRADLRRAWRKAAMGPFPAMPTRPAYPLESTHVEYLRRRMEREGFMAEAAERNAGEGERDD